MESFYQTPFKTTSAANNSCPSFREWGKTLLQPHYREILQSEKRIGLLQSILINELSFYWFHASSKLAWEVTALSKTFFRFLKIY